MPRQAGSCLSSQTLGRTAAAAHLNTPKTMPRFLKVILAAIAGFIVAAPTGCAVVELLSSANVQDRSLEASVMSLLVFGPIGSLAAGTWAWLRR